MMQFFLPDRIDVNNEVISDHIDSGRLSELVFELFQEAGQLCTITAAAHKVVDESIEAWERNQAICAGLMIRISKLMVGIVLFAKEAEHGELIMVLNRCLSESAVNLMFLIRKDDKEIYDKFVHSSLSTERAFYDVVREFVEERGALQIDERILASIQRVANLSGFEIDDIDPHHTDWAGSLRYRYEELEQGQRYVTEQRMGSHAVHGTWVDLVHNHLVKVPGGFAGNLEWSDSDGQLLGPAAVIGLEAAQNYVTEFFGDTAESPIIVERIIDLQNRILEVETSRDDWVPAEES